MERKIIIVTGANAGIGKETAMALAKTGARIIMACRNQETGNNCRDEIIAKTKNSDVILKKLDLSSFQSIREFAEDINKNEERLDVLIHNAGVWLSENLKNSYDLDLTMATNHFGPFLLTHLLIDLLKQSKSSRIIIVSSVAHFIGSLNFDNLNNYIPSYFPQINYFNSKFANICFANELARRLKNYNITVNCVHPGFINTEVWNSIPEPFSWPLPFFSNFFFKTPEQGCETTVYLATSTEVENITGKYYVNCKKAYMSTRTRNIDYNKELWEITKKNVEWRSTDPEI